jgi:predicted ATPase
MRPGRRPGLGRKPKESTMITEFSVKNYKALESVTLPLTPIHVVIGQNDSGKTSLLEAIHAFCSSTHGGLPQAFVGRWQGRELVYFGAPKAEVALAAHLDGLEDDHHVSLYYEIAADFYSQDKPGCRASLEQYSFNNEVMQTCPPIGGDQTAVGGRENVSREARADLDRIANIVGRSVLYRFDPKVMASPAAIDQSRKLRMDPDGFGLATLLDDILGHDPDVFLSLRREFCEHFPEFRSVHLETELGINRNYHGPGRYTTGQNHGKGIYFDVQGGSVIRAEQASDGAILFLGFLSLAYVPTPPKVILIEEPEKGVYPKRLIEVIDILKKITESRDGREFPQVVMTTHSPYLLTPFKPEEVTLMSRKNGSVIARSLASAPHINERLGNGEFYLGELWYNLEEEELFRDARPQPSA